MPLSRIFNVTNMSLNAIRKNKILAKISKFTMFPHFMVTEPLEPGPDGKLISTEERIQQVQQKASENAPAPQIDVSEDGELFPLLPLLLYCLRTLLHFPAFLVLLMLSSNNLVLNAQSC